jgi:hypothetical protein
MMLQGEMLEINGRFADVVILSSRKNTVTVLVHGMDSNKYSEQGS